MNRAGLTARVQTDKAEYSTGERIRLSIEVLNLSSNSTRLDFGSTQRYDFMVFKGNEDFWRWSSDKMFGMILGSLVLRPDEKRSYTEVLETAGISPGNYDLVGIITCRPPLKATSRFSIKPH